MGSGLMAPNMSADGVTMCTPIPTSERLDAAFRLAHRLHRDQSRKQSTVPYISHLMAVCAMVLEHGGDENQAIAALLHDGPEDQGGDSTLELIRNQFGDDVATLVQECTEPLARTKADWKQRKLSYLKHIEGISPRALLIAGCDKVHNAQSLVAELKTEGDRVFERFNGKARGTRWWYESLAGALGPRLPSRLRDELEQCALEIGEHPRLPVWYRDGHVRIQTSPQRYWQFFDLVRSEQALPDWSGLPQISISGAGPMFLNTFLSARAAHLKVPRLVVHWVSDGREMTTEVDRGQVAMDPRPDALLTVARRAAADVLVHSGSVTRFNSMRLPDIAAIAAQDVRPGDKVIITGKMPLALAGALSFLSVWRGARSVRCITPVEGMSMCEVYGEKLGRTSSVPPHIERLIVGGTPKAAITFGIVGFPNSGKSVLTKLMGTATAKAGVSCWPFEADPASPTPWWYVELQQSSPSRADEIRNAYKVDWTPQMQAEVARRLGNSRRFFDRVIVDLPGGDMGNQAGPQPIPRGREALFAQVDRVIILRRPDRRDNTGIWIEALKAHGFGDRVHAVIDSVDVHDSPNLVLEPDPSPEGWLVGRACGLSRDADFSAFASSPAATQQVLRLLDAERVAT